MDLEHKTWSRGLELRSLLDDSSDIVDYGYSAFVVTKQFVEDHLVELCSMNR